MKTVLTIAGSDSSGGAGIQADLKTITCHKLYGMSAITALTAQNTTGVYEIHNSPLDFMEAQLDAVFTDIIPDAVKIGMVPTIELMELVARKLKQYQAKNVVLDPVMVATSGGVLMEEKAIDTLIHKLFPMATVITPNIIEASKLSNVAITSLEDMISAARKLSQFFDGYILIKGGHLTGEPEDILYHKEKITVIPGKRSQNKNTHGTGCTLSSAIACHLAMGEGVEESVQKAKEYISGAIDANLNLGKGKGPLMHWYQW